MVHPSAAAAPAGIVSASTPRRAGDGARGIIGNAVESDARQRAIRIFLRRHVDHDGYVEAARGQQTAST
jgi:hypothetical protein